MITRRSFNKVSGKIGGGELRDRDRDIDEQGGGR